MIERVAAEEGFARADFQIGSMIELPRACLRPARSRSDAEFFSFGTNDLTQTALGFSRDDIEGRASSPATSTAASSTARRSGRSTRTASAQLVRIARRARARQTRPKLELGVCGEHGGDPVSIRFFDGVGLDYVSCSPYRVPIARVAAAQAALATRTA